MLVFFAPLFSLTEAKLFACAPRPLFSISFISDTETPVNLESSASDGEAVKGKPSLLKTFSLCVRPIYIIRTNKNSRRMRVGTQHHHVLFLHIGICRHSPVGNRNPW